MSAGGCRLPLYNAMYSSALPCPVLRGSWCLRFHSVPVRCLACGPPRPAWSVECTAHRPAGHSDHWAAPQSSTHSSNSFSVPLVQYCDFLNCTHKQTTKPTVITTGRGEPTHLDLFYSKDSQQRKIDEISRKSDIFPSQHNAFCLIS